ncbi:DUF6712 family protein [Dyadobacter sp. 22481]|uniref:DUF6712 family protein n=1 Tax=Dyadobacter sp. 22481 TaxID=3453926 RepID=UPI003F82F6CE
MEITLTTLKKHIGGVQTSLKMDTVLPFVKVATRDFRKAIGAELFAALPGLSADLLESAEGCVVWAAYDKAVPHLKIRVGDLGMAKNSPANTVAITKWEYVDTREANVAMIDLFQEFFWETLEEEMPQAWTSSQAYRERNRLFLRSATELGHYAPLVGRNSRFFADLIKFVNRAENEYIAPLITRPVFRALKTRWQDAEVELTEIERELVEKIRFAAAFLTLHEAYPYLPLLVDNEGVRQIRKKDGIREEDIGEKSYRQAQRRQLWQDAQLYLSQLTEFMEEVASPTIFPEYYESKIALSSCDETEDYTHKPHVVI